MSKSVNIKVSKEIADMILVYCKMNNILMLDFVNKVFEEKFKEFKEKFKELNEIKVE